MQTAEDAGTGASTLALKTNGQSQLKSKTESTSGSTKW